MDYLDCGISETSYCNIMVNPELLWIWPPSFMGIWEDVLETVDPLLLFKNIILTRYISFHLGSHA